MYCTTLKCTRLVAKEHCIALAEDLHSYTTLSCVGVNTMQATLHFIIASIALLRVQAGLQGWVESIIVMVTDCNADVPEARMEAVDHLVEKGLCQ